MTVDSIGYDATNKKLCLKVNGADSVIPFSGDIDNAESVHVFYGGVGVISYTLPNTFTNYKAFLVTFSNWLPNMSNATELLSNIPINGTNVAKLFKANGSTPPTLTGYCGGGNYSGTLYGLK